MRIWSKYLIPKLCRQYLLAVWRESLGAYKIITENKRGYRNHPAVIEFEDAPGLLWLRLEAIRSEMLKRGYYPKELPKRRSLRSERLKVWQTFPAQRAVLQARGCECRV